MQMAEGEVVFGHYMSLLKDKSAFKLHAPCFKCGSLKKPQDSCMGWMIIFFNLLKEGLKM